MNQLISEYKNKMQTKMEKNIVNFNTVVYNKEIEINSLKNQLDEQTQLNTTLQNERNALKTQHNTLVESYNTLDKSYNTLDKSYNTLNKSQTQQTNSNNNLDKKYIIRTVTFDENGEEKKTVEYM